MGSWDDNGARYPVIRPLFPRGLRGSVIWQAGLALGGGMGVVSGLAPRPTPIEKRRSRAVEGPSGPCVLTPFSWAGKAS